MQKRRVIVTLDIDCYDDLDVHDIDWKDLLQLEGDENVHVSTKEFDPFWNSSLMRTGCIFIRTQHYIRALWTLMDSLTQSMVYLSIFVKRQKITGGYHIWNGWGVSLCQNLNCLMGWFRPCCSEVDWPRSTPEPLMSIYVENGYANRTEYLNELREEYGDLVDILIGVLPSSEDFDGLVIALEDALDSGEYADLLWHSETCPRGTQTPLWVPYNTLIHTDTWND